MLLLEFAIRYKLSYISHRLLHHVFQMKIVYLLHSAKDIISNKGVMWHVTFFFHALRAAAGIRDSFTHCNYYADRCVVDKPIQF